MRHQRSEASEQRRLAKRIILENAFQDKLTSETVNITTRACLSDSLAQNFPYVLPDALNVEMGEVLVDARGTGSLQTEVHL